jgi:hypothetical protein
MILSRQEVNELQEASNSLMLFLRRYHPHITVLVTSERAELVEGVAAVINKEPHHD